MRKCILAAVIVVLTAVSARAELSIRSIQAAHGPLGPERKSLDYFPHDEVFFRYAITGIKADAQGDVDVTVASQVVDAGGKVFPGSKDPIKGKLNLGGGTFSGSSALRLGSTFAPGDYTFTVTVTDNLAGESVQFSRKFRIKPVELAIVTPRFFFGDTQLPAPAGGFIGQLLRVRLRAIGFDKSSGKIDAELAVQVLDAAGKELLPEPKRAALTSSDPDEVKNATHLNFTEVVGLNRAGSFTLRLTVTDKVAKQATTLELPLVVREP